MTSSLSTFVVDFFRLCAWFVLLFLLFVPLERIWPLHPQKILRRAFGSDVFYYFLSGLAPKLLLILPLTLLTGLIHQFLPAAFYQSVADWPLWLRGTAALVVGEVGAYWGHRWSHELPFLWRFHALHHSAEEIDWLVNSRVHPVDLFFTRLCALVPLYLLGLAQPMADRVDLIPILVTIVGTIWGFFIHANIKWRFGWLEWLISSPAFHHWHHTNDGPEVINKNYASMLPWLDRAFGTFYLPKAFPATYGIDAATPDTVTGQLAQPFTVAPQREALPSE